VASKSSVHDNVQRLSSLEGIKYGSTQVKEGIQDDPEVCNRG